MKYANLKRAIKKGVPVYLYWNVPSGQIDLLIFDADTNNNKYESLKEHIYKYLYL